MEAGQYARQVHGARRDRWDSADGHVAAQQADELVDGVADRCDCRERGAGVGEHGGTDRGRAHTAGRAVHQGLAELCLELADLG